MTDAQPPVPRPRPPAEIDDEIGTLVTDLANNGLAQYLADADFAEQIVNWLWEETNISKALPSPRREIACHAGRRIGRQGRYMGRADRRSKAQASPTYLTLL